MRQLLTSMLFVTLFCFVLYAGYTKLRQTIWSIDGIQITLSSIISSEREKEIERSIHACLQDSDYHAKITALKDIFAEIKSIEIIHAKPKNVAIKVSIFPPIMRVNESLVILESGRIVPADSFEKAIQNQLGSIQVETALGDFIPDELLSCISHITKQNLLQSFVLRWCNKHEIFLCPKDVSSIVVKIDFDQLIRMNIKDLYDHFLAQLKAMPLYEKRKGSMVADFRFENQIILSSENEGDREWHDIIQKTS